MGFTVFMRRGLALSAVLATGCHSKSGETPAKPMPTAVEPTAVIAPP